LGWVFLGGCTQKFPGFAAVGNVLVVFVWCTLCWHISVWSHV